MGSPIELAAKVAGGQSALARALSVSPQAVQQWIEAGRVSHKKVLEVERITGVPRHALRPDLYPDETSAAPAAEAFFCPDSNTLSDPKD